MDKARPLTLFFAYTKPANFSGQTAASELIIDSFCKKGVRCIPILLYPLTRNGKIPLLNYLHLLFKQLTTIPNILKLIFCKKPILHLNLGQGYWSFLRIGFWYFPTLFFNRSIRVVTSLHGSTFMTWNKEERKTRLFMSFLNSSRNVTVLGEKQKDKLVQLGLSREKIIVVPNSCNMAIVPKQFIDKKHNATKSQINLLHLSLLIESKGFMIYLEALELLSRKKLNQPIKAILCGPITFSPFCHQFKSSDDKQAWIEKKVDLINRISDGRVTVEWIPGAGGLQKQKLFEDAHIFVFPSTFPVEAQPIVLLEALATGSAIITSTVGEIPSTLNQDCAVFIEKPEPHIIAAEIYKLIINPEKRIELATNGLELIKGSLSLDSHISTWHSIFNEIQN